MHKMQQLPLSKFVISFLSTKGHKGANLQEIYQAVHTDFNNEIPTTSIRGIIYTRLITSKSRYKTRFERIKSRGISYYRLLDK